MDVTPFSGVKIQKVGAIYTRTLEEGGAIYSECGVPEPANVPEYGATLHVQNGPNCAIYPIFNLNPFFRDRTFRSSKR